MSIYQIETIFWLLIWLRLALNVKKSYTKGEISYKLRKVVTIFFFPKSFSIYLYTLFSICGKWSKVIASEYHVQGFRHQCTLFSRIVSGNKGSRQLEEFPRLWHGFSRLGSSGCLVEFSASVVSKHPELRVSLGEWIFARAGRFASGI